MKNRRSFYDKTRKAKKMWISPDNQNLRYTGRIDWSDAKAPVWVFPCTSVQMRITGSVLKIHVKNENNYWENYLGCIVDQVQSCCYLKNEKETVWELALPENETGEHEVLVFKRQDACHHLTILGFEIEDGAKLLPLPEPPKRKIEVYGDSVSAGEVSEALESLGESDPEHRGGYSNSWYSYSWMTARRIQAQIHDIAQGGIPLLNGTGWFSAPDYLGMESMWDKVCYNPAFGKTTKWNFADYTPQVVIVAIGQNDANPEDYMKEDYDGTKGVHWRAEYQKFLAKLRSTYPKAEIICMTTLLGHDAAWDRAIGEVVEKMKDDHITHYLFKRNGCGTKGHLCIPEASEMAVELSAYIESRNVEGWE